MKRKLFTLLTLLLCVASGAWAAAGTTSDGKYASGTITFSEVGSLSDATCYWYNGIKFFSNSTGNTKTSSSNWTSAVTYPGYASDLTGSSNWTASSVTTSGLVLQRHCLAVNVNGACTITAQIACNSVNGETIPNLAAKIDNIAYATSYTTSNYTAGTAKSITSSLTTTNTGKYTVTVEVEEEDLTDGSAVVKFYYGSSGTGDGKVFIYESITVTPAGVSAPSFNKTAGTSLVKSSGTVSLTSTGNTIYYKWSESSSAYAANQGSTLAAAADGSGTSPVDATAPSTTGTWYLYAVAKDGEGNYSNVVSRNYSITEQTWTISFNKGDGNGTMADIEGITNGGNQTLTANAFTRDCYTFSHWTANVDVTVNDATVTAGSAIVGGATIQNITSNITLTSQWTPIYASGAYTFYNNATVGADPSKTVTTSNATYSAFRVDNLFFSGMKIQLEVGTSGDGDNYQGWKMKTAGTIKFLVETDKIITVGLGTIGSNSSAKISYTKPNGDEVNNASLSAATNNTCTAKGGTMVTISISPDEANNKSVTLKKIFILDDASTITATVGKNGYTTFSSPYALDLTNANRPAGLKAYKATRDGANLTFTALDQTVPAGTGLLLLGETKDGSYDIPVVASGDAVSGNALIGVTSPTPKQSVKDNTYYFVMKKAATAGDALAFAPLSTSSAVTIPAGKAYVEVPNSAFGGSAQELSFSFDDESGDVTGIADVSNKKSFNGEFYNLNGQKVKNPTKGLYIVNGKKVIVR